MTMAADLRWLRLLVASREPGRKPTLRAHHSEELLQQKDRQCLHQLQEPSSSPFTLKPA